MIDINAMITENEIAIEELDEGKAIPEGLRWELAMTFMLKELEFHRQGQTELRQELIATQRRIGEQAARNLQIDQEEQAAHMIGI